MDENVKEKIQDILSRVIDILEVKEEKDAYEIKQLSSETIKDSSIYQDEDSISAAIFLYSLAKLMEKKKALHDYQKVFQLIKKAKDFLDDNEIKEYRDKIRQLFFVIKDIDSKVTIYIDEIIEHVKIKKASYIYSRGISLSTVAGLLGITSWELMDYVGKTSVYEKDKEKISSKKRLAYAKKIFNLR